MCTVNIAAANQKAELEIKNYIRNIKSVAIEFNQEDSAGNKAQGMLIIDKPYKFRCNYYEPFPLLISGNKNYISVYDFEMENISRIKAKDNIFNFLLLDDVNFHDQFRILSVNDTSKDYAVKIQSLKNDKISEITFDKKSKNIIEMRVFEENNIITLSFGPTWQINSPPGDLFIMQNPNIFGVPKRYDRQKLKKLLSI